MPATRECPLDMTGKNAPMNCQQYGCLKETSLTAMPGDTSVWMG